MTCPDVFAGNVADRKQRRLPVHHQTKGPVRTTPWAMKALPNLSQPASLTNPSCFLKEDALSANQLPLRQLGRSLFGASVYAF